MNTVSLLEHKYCCHHVQSTQSRSASRKRWTKKNKKTSIIEEFRVRCILPNKRQRMHVANAYAVHVYWLWRVRLSSLFWNSHLIAYCAARSFNLDSDLSGPNNEYYYYSIVNGGTGELTGASNCHLDSTIKNLKNLEAIASFGHIVLCTVTRSDAL